MLMIIACITMLIDHIGGHVLCDIPAMRIIGRIAMPIYAYLIVGSYEHTHDRERYMKRLLCNAALSQIPYSIMIGSFNKLNICFTWAISVLILMFLDKPENKRFIPIIILISASCIVPMDYGIYAVVWVILFYFRNKMKGILGNFVLIIGAVANYCMWGIPIQFAALLALPIIFLTENREHSRLTNKTAVTAYRFFYPAHMAIIDIYNML